MSLTRRDLLRSGAALGTAAVLGLESTTRAWAAPGLARPQGTTLVVTLHRGAAGAGGYAPVVRRAGEPHVVRTDLGVPAGRKRAARRRGVIAFAHLTDSHIVDAQSPMRVATSVAIAFEASCTPFVNANASTSATAMRSPVLTRRPRPAASAPPAAAG
jgi:hypothetical protein